MKAFLKLWVEKEIKREKMSIFIEGHSRMLKEGFRRKWLELLFYRGAFAQRPVFTHKAGVRVPAVELPSDAGGGSWVSHTCVTF